MNLQEILHALKSREISPEDAKRELARARTAENTVRPETHPEGDKPDFHTGKEAVAIIGMSGRYPGASNLHEYWDNLVHGRNSIREIPKSRWNVDQYYDPRPSRKGKVYCKHLGSLDDIEYFDPMFFNISPAEAEGMDPQQRIFIQEAYKAFEDAGYSCRLLNSKKCGVYLGIMSNEYGMMLYQNKPEIMSMTGNSYSIAAARISYFLNLKGPAIPVDTACSSSMVSTHLAYKALLSRDIDMALVGGVTLYLTPEGYMGMCAAGMLSKDGQCKPFDNGANGFVPGEGAGALVLKRLEDAEADGDHIYGVINGSGINQDGKTNGITAPSVNSQIELERDVYERYGIHPGSIGYVEMHGTGTKLGDPIELEALSTVFKEKTNQKNYCAIGSVKSAIGHTSAAAGVAGIQKVLMCLKHKKLVPTLNFNEPNQHFDFENSPFYVNTEFKDWDSNPGSPRRACVSSFGFSGTNAHIVMEEYIPKAHTLEASHLLGSDTPLLFVLSAKSMEQLKAYAQDILEWVVSHEDIRLLDMAYTLQVGREAMDCRLAFTVDSKGSLIERLRGFIAGNPAEGVMIAQIQRGRGEAASREDGETEKSLLRCRNRKERLDEAAGLWMKGITLDWEWLYDSVKPRRISLPTYPFARERYWIPGLASGKGSEIEHRDAGDSSGESNRKICFLKKRWQPCTAAPAGGLKRTVAILATQETMRLAVRLSQHFPGSSVLDIDTLGTGDKGQENDWKAYDGCVDVTGCGSNGTGSLEWIAWLQQLVEQGHKDGLMMLCVTKGLESFLNSDINLSGASSAGLYRMLQSEYGYLRSRHMDADFSIGDDTLSELIASEFLVESEEAEICYREGKRYAAYLEEYNYGDDKGKDLVFPENHVLWVTGGTRGIGYLCAKHFIINYGVRLVVLTGREEMPPRSQWDSYEGTDSIAQKIMAVKALEEHGAQVKVLSVALSDENALRECLTEVKNTMGPLGGVIHSAGIVDLENPAFVRKPLEGIRNVLEPKVDGLYTVYRCFKNEPLKFFILFSSASAVISSLGAGQSDYVMANAYMDYFAEAHSRSLPVISIQWPSWKETGFGEAKSRAYTQSGLLSQTNKEGLGFLDNILSRTMGPAVLPAVVNPDVWEPHLLMRRTTAELRQSGKKPAPAASRPAEASTGINDAVRTWLAELFSRELKMDIKNLDADTNIQDYGVDSIFLAQIITRMERELKGIAVEPSALMEYPTIKGLSGYLIQNYPEAVELHFQARVTGMETAPGDESSRQIERPAIGLKKTKSLRRVKWGNSRGKVAVIGMACHFPEAPDIGQYWDNLRAGKDCIKEIPKSRWNWEEYFDSQGYSEGKSVSKWGAFLDGIENFDPGYFNIPETMATQIDPLQRQWLEVSAEALADAGYKKDDLWGRKVGVFAGARAGNFAYKLGCFDKDRIVGVGQNFIASHLAHIYNFKGPNMVVDTACSSSLTAIHLAVKSIREGESEIALAGGVDILLDGSVFVGLSNAKILSPEGRCKTFSAEANGIGLGEGCGVLVLKDLQKAVRDNDKIYGVIEGSAVNNDGHTMGVTTPNPEAQRELIKEAAGQGGINPETISYVETHGTGTLIGDPIELKALTQVFTEITSKKQFCGVGSVKSNLGHLLSAAGAAGIIKVLLAIAHRELPPTLNCNNPNPRFNFTKSPLYPVQDLLKWTSENHVLRAGISSFGLGGNNAHIILSDEGIPDTNRATLEPRGGKVVFNRKRYWPEELKEQPPGYVRTELSDDPAADGYISHNREEEGFMEFFESARLENGSENR